MPVSTPSGWDGIAPRVVTPTGELTAESMPELRRWVAMRLSEGVRRIVVDLSCVSLVDESAQAGLLICARAARAANSLLVVTNSGNNGGALHARPPDPP